MRRWAKTLLLSSAFVAGAGGMGLQGVLLAYLGLACGHALGGAIGPGLFVAGWCAGAWLAGRHRGRETRALTVLVLAAPAVAALAVAVLRAAAPKGDELGIVSMFAVAVAALPQGMFLTLQCRAWSRAEGRPRVDAVFVANLVGALCGAWWIGLDAVAAWGRTGALALSNGVVAAGAALGVAGAMLVSNAPESSRDEGALRVGDRQAAWFAAIVAFWVFGLEWLCLRLALLWTGSQVGELTRIVASSLLALALGAAIVPRLVHRDSRGALEVLLIAAIASTWPLWCASTLEWIASSLPDGPRSEWALSLALTVPTLAPLGAVVPVLHRAMRGESGARLGTLMLFEAAGALAAGPVLHFAVVPRAGVGGAIAWLTLCAALAAFGFARQRALRPRVAAVAIASMVVCAFALRAPAPALDSPKLSDPSLVVRAFAEDAHFAVSVVDDGLLGERTLLTDTFRAAGDGRDYEYMRVLGHLPVLLHRAPQRVAVVALGTGTTVGSAWLHPEVETIDVFEISPAVVGFAPWFEGSNRGALGADDGRVRVVLGDGRRRLAASERSYDVVTIEPLLPDSPFGVYLYTPEFYASVRGALADGGLFAQWVPPHALPGEVCDAVIDAFARSFEWSSVWLFGTQAILIGGEREPELFAARFESTSSELGHALARVGLASPQGLRARWIGDLTAWPRSPRALRDDDPWIAWRDRSGDARALEWLPRNLERITAAATPPPWRLGANEEELSAAVAAAREARIALAWREAALRRGESDGRSGRELVESALADVGREGRADPEIRALLEEAEFLDALRGGVRSLAAGDARSALRELVRAAELRPERGDAHLYVAAALQALGEDQAAAAALARTSKACPRWRETPAGARALSLGLRAP